MAHYNPNAISYTLYETTNLVVLFTWNAFQLTFTESQQFHGVKYAVEIRKDIYKIYMLKNGHIHTQDLPIDDVFFCRYGLPISTFRYKYH